HGMARDDGRGEQWPYVGDLCDRVDHPALDAHRVLDPGTELGDVRVAEQSRHDGRDRAARVLDLEVEGTGVQARRIEEVTEARAEHRCRDQGKDGQGGAAEGRERGHGRLAPAALEGETCAHHGADRRTATGEPPRHERRSLRSTHATFVASRPQPARLQSGGGGSHGRDYDEDAQGSEQERDRVEGETRVRLGTGGLAYRGQGTQRVRDRDGAEPADQFYGQRGHETEPEQIPGAHADRPQHGVLAGVDGSLAREELGDHDEPGRTGYSREDPPRHRLEMDGAFDDGVAAVDVADVEIGPTTKVSDRGFEGRDVAEPAAQLHGGDVGDSGGARDLTQQCGRDIERRGWRTPEGKVG